MHVIGMLMVLVQCMRTDNNRLTIVVFNLVWDKIGRWGTVPPRMKNKVATKRNFTKMASITEYIRLRGQLKWFTPLQHKCDLPEAY